MHKKRNMRKSNKRKKQKKKRILKVGWVLIGIVVCVVTFSLGYATYAKYFSQSAKAGIAIATGIYFTANYAVQTDPSSDVYFESVVESNYGGATYSFDFEVRNYENNLLFNESSVTIPYSISFWVGEQPSSANYTVTTPDGSVNNIGITEANKTVIEGQRIDGGAALANKYKISINVVGGAGTHTAVPIYVEVTTDEGAVITRTLCGKMVLKNATEAESYIETQQFVVENTSGTDNEKFSEIQSQSEFMYEIRTVGNVLNSEEMTEEIKVSWDPTVFAIDLFDEAYLEWIASGTNITGPGTDGTWQYITVKVMPYASETIGFFRGVDFSSKVTNMTTLNQYIKAEKYTIE